MADEALINRLYNIVSEIARIGGEQENTSITPGIEVVNASPVDLPAGYIKIVNPRDGTYVPCLTVNGLVVADGDLVNVLFTKGTEPIALSQSSQSPSNSLKVSEVWESDFDAVALAADVDGNIGIGTSGPDAKLDILDTAGAQLRLTHTDGSKFVDFTLDTNHDLTITPSSTGQIILQPTTDSADFFQILDADGGDPVLNVDAANEAVSVRTATNQYQFQGVTTQVQLFVQDADVGNVRSIVLSRSSNSAGRGGQSAYIRARAGGTAVQSGDVVGYFNFEGHDGTDYNLSAQFLVEVDGAVSANTVPMTFIIKTGETGSGGLVDRLHVTSDGDIGIGNVTSPEAQVHIDQFETTEAQPVLLLDQGDVDEPFTKYRGEAASADLTRSIVDNGDVATATLIGWTKIEIDDVGNQVTDGDYYRPFYSLA